MSYICNKLSSVFHTRQNLVLKKNKYKITRREKKECLQVLHCAVLRMHNTLTVDWSGLWHVDTKCPDKMSFFFLSFFFFLKKNKADLIKQVRGVGWSEALTVSAPWCQKKAMPGGVLGPSWRRGAAKDKVLLQGGVERWVKECILFSLGAGITLEFFKRNNFKELSLRWRGWVWLEDCFFVLFLFTDWFGSWKSFGHVVWKSTMWKQWKHTHTPPINRGTYDSGGPRHLKGMLDGVES